MSRKNIFFSKIEENSYLLYQLVKRDLISKYVDSYLGLTWAIIEPLAMTTILSIVFIFGFKAGVTQNIPFFLYMFSGMVAFNFFSLGCNEGTAVIRNYAYLVKKVNFQVSLLPVVKSLSNCIFHLIMVFLLTIVLLIYGYLPTLYWLQFFYYFFAMIILVLGLSWLTSALNVFVPDVGRLVGICLQFLFYLSPVFWSLSNLPPKYAIFFKLNPMFYIIQGYRDSFIFSVGFWEYPYETLVFWTEAGATFVVGFLVFKKLRPQFADVL